MRFQAKYGLRMGHPRNDRGGGANPHLDSPLLTVLSA